MSLKEDFSKKRILVVGDVMLDWYSEGQITRLNPEERGAPEVEILNDRYTLGGAGNVAANISSLGAEVDLIGLRGRDEGGNKLEHLCEQLNIQSQLIVDSTRPTTVKQRIMAGSRQIVRMSRESREKIAPNLENSLSDFEIDDYDAIIFSDYAKGMLTEYLSCLIQQKSESKSIFSAVDPKPQNSSHFILNNLVSPNLKESLQILGKGEEEAEKEAQYLRSQPERQKLRIYHEIGDSLKRKMACNYALVTCGGDGMFCSNDDDDFHYVPTIVKEVYDVSGAGDTVIAAVTLALVAGHNIEKAMDIANHAAGVVVSKVGTATCSSKELVQSYRE